MPDTQKLRELLEKESYPHLFTFKFIGKNSVLFQEAVRQLESETPGLVLQTQRLSQNQNHRSYTYTLNAESADLIIEIFQKISKLPDLLIIL